MGDIGEPRAEFEVLPTHDLDQQEPIAPELSKDLPLPQQPESQPPAR